MWLLISTNIIHYYQFVSSIFTWSCLFQTLIITVLLKFIYTQFIYVLYVSPLRNMPSTNFVPIVGNVPDFMKMEVTEFMEMWFEKLKAPISRQFWILGQERVVITDADLAKQIFVNKSKIYPKSRDNYDPLKLLLGNGLVTAEGNVHRRNRKLCNNFFKMHLLKDFVPIFDKSVMNLIDVWLTEIRNTHHEDAKESFTEFLIEKEMTNFTLDVIGKFAFEYDFNAIKRSDNEETQNFRNLIEFYQISWGFIIFTMFPSLNTSYVVEHKKAIANVNNIVYSVIKKKREQLSQEQSGETSLLESLLMAKNEETGEKMDDEQIRDEVMTFMIAGHETTGITLSWCLLEAARHPEMQQKIRDELDSVITPGTSLSFDDVENLTYTKCFIQETLRMYPPVISIVREAKEDNYLHNYLIPKGTNVMVDVGVMHRNPKYWDEPLEFRPERFSDPSKIYPNSFQPFISGSRMCIGYKFAMLEMTAALARLMSKFHFETIPGVTYKRTHKMTLRPRPSLILRVSEVKGNTLPL